MAIAAAGSGPVARGDAYGAQPGGAQNASHAHASAGLASDQARGGASMLGDGHAAHAAAGTPTSGGVRDQARATANFDSIKADMTARFGDWRAAEAAGFTVREDVAFYRSRNETYAHAHGPKVDGKQLELMYEITPDGEPGRLVGIMMPVTGDLGAGKAHGHGKDGTGMQQHVWFLRKDGGEWNDGPGQWQEIDPSDPVQLDRAFDGDRPDGAH